MNGLYIQRALVVVEAVDQAGHASAFVVTQRGGSMTYLIEDPQHFGYYDGVYRYEPHPGPRRSTVTLDGYGEATYYHDADTLFRQWSGPQPGGLTELPAPRKELP